MSYVAEQSFESWEAWRAEAKQSHDLKSIFALARRVLVVAVWRVEGWTTYCDAVPGINHSKETPEVVRVGVKLQEHIARAMFPQYEKIPYIR